MPEIPRVNDRYVNPDGKVYLVLSIHPPYITARKRRGWAVTLMDMDASTMHLVSMDLLAKGGFKEFSLS